MSHFRSASLALTQNSLYSFDFGGQISFRASAFSNPQVGQVITNNDVLNFGDGASQTIYFKILSISNDVLVGQIVAQNGSAITHTYASSVSDYEAYFQSSARVTTNDAYSNGGYRSEVIVNAGIIDHAPVSNVPPVVQVADNTVFTYQLSASDADGDPLTYSLGTANDFISNGAGTAVVAPAGVTLSTSGLLTWDVTNGTGANVSAGQLYTITVKISDGHTATPVDFLFSIVDASSNQAPYFINPPTGNQSASVGSTSEIAVVAGDPNDNLQSISVLNPPAGLVTTYHPNDPAANQGELHLDFTPTAAGTYVVNIQATDSGGLTAQTSITYVVSSSPQLAINDVTLAEGNSGSTPFNFTVTRSNGDLSGTSTVAYQVANGSTNPTDSTDFSGGTLPSGTVTFGPNETTKTVTVNVAGDYAIESNEQFFVNLSAPTNATISDAQGLGIVTNDDVAGSLTITPRGVTEGDTGQTSYLTFDITRSGGATGDIVFRLATDNNTGAGYATQGTDFTYSQQDYAFSNGVFTSSGTTTATFTVPIIGDYAIEGNETVTVSLYQPATSGLTYSGGVGTIIDNDTAGGYSVADVSVTEGDTGSQQGFFTITRTGLGAASVNYVIAPGGSTGSTTATAGVDYNATTSGTIAFAGGQTSAVVPFTVIGDRDIEANEQFRLSLTSATDGGTFSRPTGYATIIDNDVSSNAQFGTNNNDVLIAQTSQAVLIGFGGDDTYLVHGLGDVVIEANGGGTDIVYTDVSYNLGNNEVEALSVAQQTGTANINLIGNFVSQTIVGNYGDNVLNGGSGADTLIGLYGNDTYAVGDSRIVIQEQAGQGFDTVVTSVNYALGAGVSIEQLVAQDRSSTVGLSLTGNGFAQTIGGTSGADTINGGLGADTLIGFGGADTFAFTTALGNGNVDTLADFAAGTDKIGLSSGIFGAIGTSLDANEFVTGTAAATADQHIIYNATTGQIFYDADGSGAGAAVLFAVVAPGTALAVTDFTVVAPATPAT